MAGMQFDVKLVGFQPIKEALRILPDKMVKGALRQGTYDAAKEIREIARMKAPYGRGRGYLTKKGRRKTKHLKDQIIARRSRGTRNEAVAKVGWSTPIGHLLEFGHRIVPRARRGQSNKGGGSIGFVAPRPHMRPALESGIWRAIRTFRLTVKRAILYYGAGLTATGRARKR